MQQEIYTPMEEVLIKSAELAQALETKKQCLQAIALDGLLLEMEEKLGLMDGITMEGWEL